MVAQSISAHSVISKEERVKNDKRKLYVGIDIHSREHRVALMPLTSLEQPDALWRKIKPLRIKNDITDFERLETAIKSHVSSAEEVAIAVDHTGGHYSEPVVHFLKTRGYTIYYLETKAVKAARERFLDQENKSDSIDATSTAYLLYLRDLHGLSFRISAVTPDLGSKAAALNSLVLQRWQFNKLINQVTNRLHQLLIAVFPEGEVRYFNDLLKIIPYYPIPQDMLASNGLEEVNSVSQRRKAEVLELAANTVGVPGNTYRWLIRDLGVRRTESLSKRDTLTSVIREEIAAHPYGDTLLSFPYIGEIAAATIIGIIKDIRKMA